MAGAFNEPKDSYFHFNNIKKYLLYNKKIHKLEKEPQQFVIVQIKVHHFIYVTKLSIFIDQ